MVFWIPRGTQAGIISRFAEIVSGKTAFLLLTFPSFVFHTLLYDFGLKIGFFVFFLPLDIFLVTSAFSDESELFFFEEESVSLFSQSSKYEYKIPILYAYTLDKI